LRDLDITDIKLFDSAALYLICLIGLSWIGSYLIGKCWVGLLRTWVGSGWVQQIGPMSIYGDIARSSAYLEICCVQLGLPARRETNYRIGLSATIGVQNTGHR